MPKILLIDDEPIDRELASTMLQQMGYEIVEAEDGQKAQQILSQQQVDIILTDILMPEVDGIELILALRGGKSNLPIIAISGGGTINAENYLTMAKELGADAVMQKPLDWEDLAETIDRLTAD